MANNKDKKQKHYPEEEQNPEKDQPMTPDNDRTDGPGEENTPEVETLKTELEEMRNKYLRLYAEFDNFKKRTVKEKIEFSKRAGQDVLLALLPVLDDFDRAKQNADDPDNEEYFSEGVQLVYNKLHQVLKNQGLTAMDTEDRTFNPELHDAIADVPVEEEEQKGKIIDFIEKGYLLNDRILRHAKVVVGKK